MLLGTPFQSLQKDRQRYLLACNSFVVALYRVIRASALRELYRHLLHRISTR